MKSNKTLLLAASIFTLALSAFPHHAAASSAAAPPSSSSQMLRIGGDKPVKYMQVELAVNILLLALLP
jgi:hypothetical protein